MVKDVYQWVLPCPMIQFTVQFGIGVTAQVHWVLAGTLLSGKCAAVYLVHLHPLICGHIRCEENL